MHYWRNWVFRTIGAVFVLFIISIFLMEISLRRINENQVSETGIDYIEGKILFGSALSGDLTIFKLGQIAKTKPLIVAIGSSRVKEIRQKFFKDGSFYTLGGLVASMADVNFVAEEVINSYSPKVIILGIDMWWLNPNISHNAIEWPLWGKRKNIFFRKFYMYQVLWKAIKSNPRVRKEILSPSIKKYDAIGGRPTIGLMASVDYRGYREDGSMQYGDYILHKEVLEKRMSDTKKSIDAGEEHFKPCYSVDTDKMALLQSIINKIRNKGCNIVVFLTPFPNEIYKQMLQSDRHKDFLLKFESEVKALCERANVSFYDFSNMDWVGSSDNEALDGLHGSERTYAKIILKMKNDKYLGEYIATDYIEERLRISDDELHIIPFAE